MSKASYASFRPAMLALHGIIIITRWQTSYLDKKSNSELSKSGALKAAICSARSVSSANKTTGKDKRASTTANGEWVVLIVALPAKP